MFIYGDIPTFWSAEIRMTRPVPVAPIVVDMVRAGIIAQEGAVYDTLDRCPWCGGPVRPYDLRPKRFATLCEPDGRRDIRVRVKRFRCGDCKKLCYADSPFYPGTRHGGPVVELASVLAEQMPPGQVVRTLFRLGIHLDRATIRCYSRLPLPPIATVHLFGLPVPVSILGLSIGRVSSLLSRTDRSVDERKPPSGATVQQGEKGENEYQKEEGHPPKHEQCTEQERYGEQSC